MRDSPKTGVKPTAATVPFSDGDLTFAKTALEFCEADGTRFIWHPSALSYLVEEPDGRRRRITVDHQSPAAAKTEALRSVLRQRRDDLSRSAAA